MSELTPNPIDVITKALADLAENRTAVDAVYKDLRYLEFRASPAGDNLGKGMIFSGTGTTKQFVLGANPDHFHSTENVNLAKGKALMIGGAPVVTENSLGTAVTKSNLKELGRLRNLVVDGNVSINQHMFFNSNSDRLGLGTEEPVHALGVVENGIEVMIGASDEGRALIGTQTSTDFEIKTDNTARITVKGNGNIELGNSNRNPVQVKVNGKLAVGVSSPDAGVDLHVSGAVRFNNSLQTHGSEPPASGAFAVGDIVWNTAPRAGGCVGWVCTRAGSPGVWNPFGEIRAS